MKLTQEEKRELANTKALAKWVASEMPQPQVPIHKPSYAKRRDTSQADHQLIEQSYDQLDGEWLQWLEVARRFEHKAQAQDRLDLRHTIIVAFADQQARNERLGKPDLSFYGMLRIASHCVADYWRERLKREVKVCVYNGRATELKCASCRHKPKAQRCPYQASRPIQSLDQPTTDYEGYECRLLDTLADDSVDVEAWAERSTWELGYPKRLVLIAHKIDKGRNLTATDSQYLWRYRKRTQKSLL